MNTAKKSIIATGALFLLMSAAPLFAADQEMVDTPTVLHTQDQTRDRIDQDDATADQDKLQIQERTRTRDRISRPDVSSSRPDFSRPSMGSRPGSR